jgi:hypothetical protein
MDLKSSVKVIVPNASLPSAVANAVNKSTLLQYVRSQLANSEATAGTRGVTVEAVSKVFIGSPSSADITTAFKLSSSVRSQYFKNSETSIELSGLVDRSTYFKNSGVLNCEGDLALRGPVYFKNLQVNSASGCRIYVIGSVFIYGEISHLSPSEDRNLQITSTEPISMGLGLTKKNNQFCEPESQYATKPADNDVSSLVNRYKTFWTTPSYSTRQQIDPSVSGAKVIADFRLIEAGEGSLLDAACRAEGRQVGFERLLLNAPGIQSRYQGNFLGTIISEYAVMSLGQFKFQYDNVFDRVPVLPMLNHKIYLDIEP